MDDYSLLELQAGEGWVDFQVRVQPRAPFNEICGMAEGALKLRVKAPPVQGKANKAVEEFLAEVLQVSKTKVRILSGETSRRKRVRIWGLGPQELLRRLEGKK